MSALDYADELRRRFAAKVHVVRGAEGCWFWTGTRKSTGYGQFWNGHRTVQAHRWSWEQRNGPIPEGLEIDHLCKQRDCVNPRHLEVVTRGENVRRSSSGAATAAVHAARTHCREGHELTPENTYVPQPGWRRCRTCMRLARRERTLRA